MFMWYMRRRSPRDCPTHTSKSSPLNDNKGLSGSGNGLGFGLRDLETGTAVHTHVGFRLWGFAAAVWDDGSSGNVCSVDPSLPTSVILLIEALQIVCKIPKRELRAEDRFPCIC